MPVAKYCGAVSRGPFQPLDTRQLADKWAPLARFSQVSYDAVLELDDMS